MWPASPSAFVGFVVKINCHSDWGETESQCSFNLHFLVTKDTEHFFQVYWPLVLHHLRALYLLAHLLI